MQAHDRTAASPLATGCLAFPLDTPDSLPPEIPPHTHDRRIPPRICSIHISDNDESWMPHPLDKFRNRHNETARAGHHQRGDIVCNRTRTRSWFRSGDKPPTRAALESTFDMPAFEYWLGEVCGPAARRDICDNERFVHSTVQQRSIPCARGRLRSGYVFGMGMIATESLIILPFEE